MPPDNNLHHSQVNSLVSRDNVLELMANAIRYQRTIPQDVLYRVPGGPTNWEYLIREDQSLLRHVYDQFRHLNGPVDKIALHVKKRFSIEMTAPKDRLGVLALGCGDGWREQAICKGLLQHKLANCLDVAFIDLSNDLLAMAMKNITEVTYAGGKMYPHYLDFEDTSKLRSFREEFTGPMLVLLIGNTIGNVDASQMLFELNKALPAGDHLLLEVLMHKDQDVDDQPVTTSAQDDPRARLIVNPLRQLGILEPDLTRLFITRETTAEGGIITRKYIYRFDRTESKTIKHYSPDDGDFTILVDSEISLLEVKSMSTNYLNRLLSDIFDDVDIIEHPYVLDGKPIALMGYAFGTSRKGRIIKRSAQKKSQNARESSSSAPHPNKLCTTCRQILAILPTQSEVTSGTHKKVRVTELNERLGNIKPCIKYLKKNEVVTDENRPRSGLLKSDAS